MGNASSPAPHLGRPLALHPFQALLPGRGTDASHATASGAGTWAAGVSWSRPPAVVRHQFQEAVANGELVTDESEALYLHEYTAAGMTVRGIVGALDLGHRTSDPSQRSVYPHEGVIEGAVSRLCSRWERLRLDPAPILLVYRGHAGLRARLDAITATPALLSLAQPDGQFHRLWAIRTTAEIRAVNQSLSSSHAVIADGHHRFAAHLRLNDARSQDGRSKAGSSEDGRSEDGRGEDGWNRGLAMLVDQDDTPLFLGAIHRLLAGVTLEEVIVAAHAIPSATVTRCGTQEALGALAPDAVVVTDGISWAVVRIAVSPAGPAAVERVDAELLPTLPTASVAYAHTVEDALREARKRSAVAVLLPAIGFDAVDRIVASNRLLPQKATSFQPKPAAGIVLRHVGSD